MGRRPVSSRPVILNPEAVQDLTEIRQWYAAQRPGLEHEFTAAMDRIVAVIEANAEAFAVVRAGVRRAPLSGFPHGVFFRLEAAQVTVFAVMHPKRDPKTWTSRP